MKCALIEVEFKFMYCIPQCMYVQQIKTLHQYCTNTVKHCWGMGAKKAGVRFPEIRISTVWTSCC